MSDEAKKPYSILELRGKYPKIGKKWEAEEDQKLKKLYTQKQQAGFGDFDAFVEELTKEFGRAAGGIKARMAKYFTDVPGWDYGREKFREEEMEKLVAEKIKPEHDEILFREYKKYYNVKNETYINLLKRLSETIGGSEAKFISYRLKQLNNGELKKFTKEDINPFSKSERNTKSQEEPFIKPDLTNNPEAEYALDILENTRENLFLSGEAGTGKSTLLNYFRKTTKKNVVVLASTGVAALNVEGQTIHSFCGFGPDITLAKVKKLMPGNNKLNLLRKLETIVIDEISMVRADLLDCVDKFLRINSSSKDLPFGGIQMVFIGDLYQLPPVEKNFQSEGSLIKIYNSPYFFESQAFKNSKFKYIQLKTIYRQKDPIFKKALNAVRNNLVSNEHLEILNSRVAAENNKFTFEQFAVYLSTTNARAKQINNFFLKKIEAPIKTFYGSARGNFVDKEQPTDLDLQIKIGAQIMMLNNDTRKRWVNGTMGKIVGIKESRETDSENIYEQDQDPQGFPEDLENNARESNLNSVVIVELESGEIVYVEPHTWEMFKFVVSGQEIDSKTTGTFTQYPFKLAWAVTIHKAQGKTFDKVYIDLSTGTFAHGQLYVALSRCRTLEGLHLKRAIRKEDIILDSRIETFLKSFNSTII